jgi:hypothetical protein
MTTVQDFCTALDKLNAAIREVKNYLDNHAASQLGEITLELPDDFTQWYYNDWFSYMQASRQEDGEVDGDAYRYDVFNQRWRLRFDYLSNSNSKDLILEYWDKEGGYWEAPTPIENENASVRTALAPYLPMLIRRADEILEMQTGQLEQNVQGIYEALEAAMKDKPPTVKPGKKRK